MTDEDAESVVGTNIEDDRLQDHITRWVEVLDGWVKRVEAGMGRRDGDAAAPDMDGGDRA